jgi:hypothetical protein
MSNKLLALVLLVYGISLTATAQSAYIAGYSTVDYDPTTNTVTGYTYTNPNYSGTGYYTAGLSSTIHDSDGNALASANQQAGMGGPSVTYTATGRGCDYYEITTGHYEVDTYYVQNYYYNGQYVSGYYDPYNYSYYEGQTAYTCPGYYQWPGLGPGVVTTSTFSFLGSTDAWGGGSSCNVGMKVRYLDPDFGAPSITKTVTMHGNGFTPTTVPEVDTGVTGITFSNIHYVDAQHITFSLYVDPNKSQGDVGIHAKDGTTLSINSDTYHVRVPDRLKLITDINTIPTDDSFLHCIRDHLLNPYLRQLLFEVEDLNGNRVGMVSMKEVFSNTTTNSCRSDGLDPNPTPCTYVSYDPYNGRYIDSITVNCNTVGGSCGYSLTDQWQWCPPGGTDKTLTTLTDTVHHDGITVNGNSTTFTTPKMFTQP